MSVATITNYKTRDGESWKVEWDLPRHMVPFGQKRAKGTLTLHDEDHAERAAAIAKSLRHAVTGEQVVALMKEIFYPEEREPETTLSDWVMKFLNEPKVQRWGRNYRENNESKLNDVILPALGDRPIKQISGNEIDRFLTALKVERGIKFATVDHYFQLLSQIFNLAHLRGLISLNPFSEVAYQKGQNPEGSDLEEDLEAEKYFEPEEYERMLLLLRPDYRDFVRFLAETGVRFGEATAIRISDIQWDTNKIWIRRAWNGFTKGGRTEPGLTKNKKRRLIEVPPSIMKMLQERTIGRGQGEYIFVGTRGGVIVNSNFRRDHWNPMMIKAQQCANHPPLREDGRNGLKVIDKKRISSCQCLGDLRWTKFTPHALRHSYATWAIFGGVRLEHLSRQLGHSSTKVTEDVYVHQIDRARTANVSGTIDRVLGR